MVMQDRPKQSTEPELQWCNFYVKAPRDAKPQELIRLLPWSLGEEVGDLFVHRIDCDTAAPPGIWRVTVRFAKTETGAPLGS